MRTELLIVIVGVLALTALVKPRIGLFGYVWFALMRPDILSWSAGIIPYSNVLATATLLGSLRYILDLRLLLANAMVRWFLLLQVLFLASVFCAVRPDLTYMEYNLFLRVTVMTLLIPLFVRTLGDMKILLAVLALSIGALGVKFGLWGLLQGGVRFNGGLGNGGLISDNNCLALALAMAAPLCWYARGFFASRWIRLGLMGMLFSTIAAIVMTHSRGGALAFVAGFAPVVLRSQRKLGIVVLLVILSAPAVFLVRDSYFARLESIADYDTEVSAVSRIEYARAAVAMWKDHPLMGVGFGTTNFTRLVGNYLGRDDSHVAHNTYLQVLVDSGIFAFLNYCGLLFGALYGLQRSASRLRERLPGIEIYPQMMQCALVAFAVGSTFLSRVNFDYWYMLLMAAAAWIPIERQLLAEADEPGAGGPGVGEQETAAAVAPAGEVYAYGAR